MENKIYNIGIGTNTIVYIRKKLTEDQFLLLKEIQQNFNEFDIPNISRIYIEEIQ